MSTLASRISSAWFAPALPGPLAIIRICSGLYALWYVGTRQDMMARIVRGGVTTYEPVGPFRVLGHPMDPVAADWLVMITLVSGAFFTLGWFFRLAGPTFAVTLLLTLCYRNSWSMIYHSHNVLVFHVLVLGFARAADRFAIDSRRAGSSAAPIDSDHHGWPIRLMCAATALGYFLSGYSKVVGAQGFEWSHGRLMREQIAVDALRKELLDGSGPAAAFELWDRVWIFTALGVGTLVLELGAPLALWNRRSRLLWALSVFAMHWGILVIMDIKFRYQLSFLAFVCFLPLDSWLRRSRD